MTAARAWPPIERRTHIALADLIRRAGKPEWWWSHIASGELRTKETGALLERMGLMPGMFDFLLIAPDGRHHWLELKRDTRSVLSNDQLRFRRMLRERGVPHFVAHSFDEAVRCLTHWGMLKGVQVQ
jgi:hypothetical protein